MAENALIDTPPGRSPRERLQRLGGWAVVATAAAIPVSTAITSVFVGLAVLCAAASGLYSRQGRSLLLNPVSLSAMTLFVWLALGLVYSSAADGDALRMLMKYRDLLYIPLLLPYFTNARLRRAGLWAFIAVNLLVLAVSWGNALWQFVTLGGLQHDATVFHQRITQGLFLAFSAYWLYLHQGERPERSLPIVGLLLLIGIDMFVLVSGRTGQLIFLALGGLALYQRFHWRGLVLTLLAGAAVVILAYDASELFRDRVVETLYDFGHFQESEFDSSTSQRMSFYPNSLALIGQEPMVGHGIGSFPGEYARQVAGTRYPVTANPHNSFLLFGVEGGLIALLLFVNLLFWQWWSGRALPRVDYRLLQGFLLLVVADCILNSFMRDTNEGHLYAYFSALLYAPLLPARLHWPQD